MAVAIDARATAAQASSSPASPITFTNQTVGAGANRALLVEFTSDIDLGTVTVNWDSAGTPQLCTLIAKSVLPTTTCCYMYGLVNPTSGNKTLSITFTAAPASVYVYSIAFTGVNQTGGATTFKSPNIKQGTAAASLIITSAVGNWTVSILCDDTQVPTAPSQTQDFENHTLTNNAAGQDGTGAATVTHSWTMSNNSWVMAGVDIAAVGSPAIGVNIVQAAGKRDNSTSTTTITQTLDKPTTAGNLIVVACGSHDAAAAHTMSVTDSASQVYTNATNAYVDGNTHKDVNFCYFLNTVSGVTSVTITFSGSAGTYNKEIIVWEVNGGSTPIAAFDLANTLTGTGTGGGIDTGAAVITTSTIGFVVGYCMTDATVGINPNTGNEFDDSSILLVDGDANCCLISTTAASHTPIWFDNTPGALYSASSAAFKFSSPVDIQMFDLAPGSGYVWSDS